jgi:hypothetical protein
MLVDKTRSSIEYRVGGLEMKKLLYDAFRFRFSDTSQRPVNDIRFGQSRSGSHRLSFAARSIDRCT